MKLLPLIALTFLATPFVQAQEKDLFNGKDLTGWKGVPELWSVKDGAITGKSTLENPVKTNTFLVWQGGDVSDFELTFKYKIVDENGEAKGFGNSGVQYRSKIVPPPYMFAAKKGAPPEELKIGNYYVVAGYQADFEVGTKYSGILYEEKCRGILALRGQKVVIKEGEAADKPKIEVTGTVGDSDAIQASINPAGWNDYKIIAKGNHLQHFINGKQTVDVTDETAYGAKKGVLSLQMHKGKPFTVQFKDMKLKELK